MKITKILLVTIIYLLFSIELLYYSYNTIKFLIVEKIDETDIKQIRDSTYLTPKYKIILYSKLNTKKSNEEINLLLLKMNERQLNIMNLKD